MSDRDGESAGAPTGARRRWGPYRRCRNSPTAEFDRMAADGVARPVQVGDVVFGPGDVDYDLVLVESGWIEILSPAIGGEPESVVARYGPGGFWAS